MTIGEIRPTDNDDPDEIGDFLEEFGISLASLQAIDVPSLESQELQPETSIDDPDDIAGFLGEMGLNWGAIASMDLASVTDNGGEATITDTQSKAIENASAMTATSGNDRNDYNRNNKIPVIAGEAMYEALKTAALPEIRSLNLSQEVMTHLNTPITDARGASDMRRYICKVLSGLENTHLNQAVIEQARLGVSEALQNAVRHGGGIRRVIMGLTPYSNVFIGVENLAVDNSGDFREFRCNTDAPAVGNAALGLGIELEELTIDQHSRGLFVMAVNTVNGVLSENHTGLQQGRTISAGLCSLPVETLVKLSRGEELSESDMQKDGQLLRTISWGVYGYDTPAAREADASMAA